MLSNELTEITQSYYALLERQGELIENNENITPAQIMALSRDVVKASTAAVKLRLNQEAYREKWCYKNTLRTDKWAQRDLVREQKRARRIQLRAAKAAYKAQKRGER